MNRKKRRMIRLAALVTMVLMAVSLAPVPVAHAAEYTVCDSGCDHTTIQEAVDNVGSGDIITVMGAVHTEASIVVNQSVTIQGQGQSLTTVQAHASAGAAGAGVFEIAAGSTVTIRDMTIRHGAAPVNGGGVHNQGTLTLEDVSLVDNHAGNRGGGLCNDRGTVALTRCTVRGNEAGHDGGGIYNQSGDVTLTECAVTDNQADPDGGGIANNSGTLMLTHSTVSDNDAVGQGGGIYNDPHGEDVTLINSTVSGNETERNGGGIYHAGVGLLTLTNSTVEGNVVTGEGRRGGGIYGSYCDMVLTNSTVSGNRAMGNSSYGGGIYIADFSDVSLMQCTVSGNQASDQGGGIYLHSGELILYHSTVTDNEAGAQGGGIYNFSATKFKDTIIANNTATEGPDCYKRALASEGYNLVGDTTDCTISELANVGTNIIGEQPNLGPLADNGGPTETHALLTDSPAIDAGDPAFAPPPDFDQRGDGFSRVVNDVIDIGAYEYTPQPVGGLTKPMNLAARLAPRAALLAALVILAASGTMLTARRKA